MLKIHLGFLASFLKLRHNVKKCQFIIKKIILWKFSHNRLKKSFMEILLKKTKIRVCQVSLSKQTRNLIILLSRKNIFSYHLINPNKQTKILTI